MPIVCSEDFVSLYSTLNLTAMRTRILCLVWIGIAALVGCGGKGMRSGLSSDTFAIRSDSVYSREELSQLLSTLINDFMLSKISVYIKRWSGMIRQEAA